ncbi:MAG: 23S rRNA (adenine(2503)-C(2))-methyltransferase RlmN [Bacteroidetes bacterium]|nr:MAG: 23S rRNA (adenine(2503)-C(2))-methyltransferase RlmN [Bacteroidota bacterium]
MPSVEARLDIRKLTAGELETWFTGIGEKRFRARQVYEWLWQKSARSFDQMTNLSKSLRQRLADAFDLRPIEEDKVQRSLDGTIKSRFRLWDGHLIESVLIPVPDDRRFTVCVSSQVGCSLSCKFCATGQMKRVRNLDAAEIYDQVALVNAQCLETYGHPLTNIVYMGMGEPLLNYANVLKSIEHITAPEGLNWSPKRITVSTAGIAKMIKKLADDGAKVNLALSLHAADDAKRNEIMPINAQNNLEVLMDALRYFFQNTRNRISYEYIAFRDFNDGPDDARNLSRLCRQFPVRVNIIEYNPVEGVTFEKSREDTIDRFARQLRDSGVMVTVRRSRGKDIDAACGQLANKA